MSKGQVEQLFENRLAAYQQPKEVIFVKSFPRTTLGKIQKKISLAASAEFIVLGLSGETSEVSACDLIIRKKYNAIIQTRQTQNFQISAIKS